MLTLKIQAKTINDLFTRKQFFEDLCNESNNDINEVKGRGFKEKFL